MVGSSLTRSLLKHNYVNNKNQDNLLIPNRRGLNLLNIHDVIGLKRINLQ